MLSPYSASQLRLTNELWFCVAQYFSAEELGSCLKEPDLKSPHILAEHMNDT